MLSKMLMRKAGVPALSFNTSASSSSSSITIPAGANVGDIAVLFDYAVAFTTTIPTTVVPSGWTSVSNLSAGWSTGTRSIVSYKKLLSGDPGSSITGMSGTSSTNKQMIVLSPSSPITTVTVSGYDSEIADVAPSGITIAEETPSYAVIGCAATRTYNPTWTSAWYDATYGGSTRTDLAYKIFNSDPASVTMDFTAGGYSHASIQAFALVVT